jgi:hypothetical protein
MTPTNKRRIAREWLIFLVCIVIGFLVTYSTFYDGQQVRMGFTKPEGAIEAYLDDRPQPVPQAVWKDKNPGDMFNDLTSGKHITFLWLSVLSTYLVVLFVRSTMWSVNTLRRH